MILSLSSSWVSFYNKSCALDLFFFMTKWKFLTCLADGLEFTVLFLYDTSFLTENYNSMNEMQDT